MTLDSGGLCQKTAFFVRYTARAMRLETYKMHIPLDVTDKSWGLRGGGVGSVMVQVGIAGVAVDGTAARQSRGYAGYDGVSNFSGRYRMRIGRDIILTILADITK